MRELGQVALLTAILLGTCIDIFNSLKNKRIVLTLLQIALILVSGRYNVLFRGMEWRWIGLGILGGQIIFLVSMIIVRLSLRKSLITLLPITELACHYLEIRVIVKYIVISGFEETFWRGTVQFLLGDSAWGIFASSTFFLLGHLGRSEEVYALELLDLFLFSCVLGLLFLSSQSIYLVILIHSLRNINLSYLRYGRHRCVRSVPKSGLASHTSEN